VNPFFPDEKPCGRTLVCSLLLGGLFSGAGGTIIKKRKRGEKEGGEDCTMYM
jgi:hypothetical protein